MKVAFVAKDTFSNFKTGKEYFKQLILTNKTSPFEKIYHAPLPVANAFRELFPNLVQSRGILESCATNHCNTLKNNNKVVIKSGPVPQASKNDRVVDFLGIGGPTAAVASALAKAGGKEDVLHTYYTRRGSNFDGSAYYYHIRDAFPVYVNSVNRGPYCVYTDL